VRAVPLAAGWQDFPLAAALSERWGGPVVIQTPTQAAALAEARLGAGRGLGDLLYLALGRSVSAGFVLGGRVYAGAHGRAGDLAHWPAVPDGPRCSCGGQGHLGSVASSQGLVRAMIGRAVDHPESNDAMLAISGGRAEAMTAEQVVRLAASGDPVARAVVDELLAALAPTFAQLIAALDPAVVVLGGPLAAAGPDFLDPLAARVRALCEPVAPAPPLLAGKLEPLAALVGAVLSAQDAASPARA
jgi:glucokinase